MVNADLRSKIVAQAKAEYLAGLQFKQGRVPAWQASEDAYYGKVKKAPKGRFNVPIPIIPGFVDTLLAKVDDPPGLNFSYPEEADLRRAQKVQSMYEQDSTSEDEDWESIDLDGKKMAVMTGRAINKSFGESDPKYRFNLGVVDTYDFICDPMGGGHLENHRFVGEDNIFKSKAQLEAGVKSGIYIASEVLKITFNTPTQQNVDNDNTYQNKASRFAALGLDSRSHNFAGQALYKFIEWGTTYDGTRYYLLFDPSSGACVRCEPLKEIFKSGLWWFTSWATNRDKFNFWSKAPVDDIRPVAEVIRLLVCQELDNRQKKNWGMRAYDPEIFENPADLEYSPDGLVRVKAGTSKITQIDRGIYQFQTPELGGTINLVQWMDNFLGQKSGITPDSQGSAVEDKVGIYYGNLQQVADRIGLYNKSYRKCWAAIGRRYAWALHEHLKEDTAVKIIGNNGIEWDELNGKEVNPDIDIRVVGGNAELQQNQVKAKKRQDALALINADPEMRKEVGTKWRVEQLLRFGDYDDEEIRVALDTQNYGKRAELAKAAEDIQAIIRGDRPKLYRGATTAYIQKITDFATDSTDEDMQLFKRLMAFAEAHIPIAQKNMARQAVQVNAAKGIPPNMLADKARGGTPLDPGTQAGSLPGMPGNFPPPPADALESPGLMTPGGAQSESQQMSNAAAPQLA